MKKRVLSFLMAFVVALSLIPILGGVHEVYAGSGLTRSDAVSWARAQNGRTDNCDVDGNGLWCTDLATAYMNYLWLKTNNDNRNPWGLYPYTTKMAYAYDDYVSGNSNWTVIARNSSTVPLPGDIFVSERDSSGQGYGHVGIVLTANGSSSAEIIQMSGGVRPSITTVTWGSTASYNPQYFIRFNYFLPDSTPTPTPQGSPIQGYGITVSDGDYHIISAINPEMGLDVYGGQADSPNGTNIQIYSNKNANDQIFTVKYVGDGFYTIQHKRSKRFVDVERGALEYGTNVSIYDGNGSDNQKWVIRPSDDERFFEIASKCNGLCLDVYDNGDSNETNVQVWGDNNGTNQKWCFIACGTEGRTIEDGRYEIVTALDNSKCLDVYENGETSETSVGIYTRHQGKNQMFDVKYLNNGYYEIKAVNSGLLFDLYGGYAGPGTNLQVYWDKNTDNQKWIIKESGNNTYNIIAKHSGQYLDVVEGQTADATNVTGWYGNGATNQKWIFIPEHKHVLIKTDAKTATCTDNGNSAYWTCSDCGEYFSDANGTIQIEKNSWIIPAKGHVEETVPGKAATCTETGLTEGTKCSACGITLKEQKIIAALGHDWSEWTQTKAATEDEEGREVRVCKRNLSHIEERAIPVLGHTHTLVKVDASEATCTEPGNNDYWTCSKCKRFFADKDGENEVNEEDVLIKAKGHDWGEWHVTRDATEEQEGQEERVCGRDASHKETRPIPVLEHKHTLEKVDEKKATCTEPGHIGYWICSKCKKAFIDKDGESEIKETDTLIGAKGHDWGEWVTVKEPTATADGLQRRTCKNDPSHKEEQKIPASGEAAKKSVNDATLVLKASYAYTGKELKPVQLTYGGKKLTEGEDFLISYKDNLNAGTATAVIAGTGNWNGKKTVTFKITPVKNTITKVTASGKISYSKLKKKKQSFTIAATVKGKAGKTFKLVSVPKKVKKYISVSKAGKVIVKRGCPKGTYKIKVNITTAKTRNYKQTIVAKTVKVIIK